MPTRGDAAALAELETTTFVEEFGHQNSAEDMAAHIERAFDQDKIAAQLVDPRCRFFWIVDDGTPVAFLKLNLADAQTEPDLEDGLEVEQLYVRKSHQGTGLGRQLLEHALAHARAQGLPFVWLGVWEHNDRAIAVYERLGFQAFGKHAFFLGDDEQTDVLMRLDLDAP
jgi:diamine N-acetyltransferase